MFLLWFDSLSEPLKCWKRMSCRRSDLWYIWCALVAHCGLKSWNLSTSAACAAFPDTGIAKPSRIRSRRVFRIQFCDEMPERKRLACKPAVLGSFGAAGLIRRSYPGAVGAALPFFLYEISNLMCGISFDHREARRACPVGLRGRFTLQLA